jgi:hypothetical protein
MSSGETYVERLLRVIMELRQVIRGYKTEGSIYYTYNTSVYNVSNRAVRMVLIQRIADDYVKAHADINQERISHWQERGGKGERPISLSLNTALIDMLTNAVLDEELTDKHPDKITREEYPFLSEYQFDRRQRNEYSLDLAESYDSTGRNHAKPKRRQRTAREERFIDRVAQAKNRKSDAQYKRNTSAGPINTYNLRENGGELTEPFVMSAGIVDRYRELVQM